jgi:membrane protease YdiL (CAAX protease family)
MTSIEETTSTPADKTVLAIALLLPTVVTLLYFVILTSAPAAIQQTAYAVGKSIQFALPAVWIYLVRRERFEWIRPTRSGLLPNVLFGGAVVVLMMGLYHLWLNPSGYLAPGSDAGEEVLDKVQGFGVANVGNYAALAAFYAIIHSGLEEYYWRWFVFGGLRRMMPLRSAIALSSAGFMLHHVILLGTYFDWALLPTALFSLAVGIGGIVWAWLYHRSGSVFGPWIGHLLIDAGIFLVGYDLVHGAL